MSVKIGSFKSALIFPRIRRPSCNPGPRNEFTDDRFALSNDALNTYGRPASAAIFATRSAIIRACVSDSITHAPAIRKRDLPPRRTGPAEISVEGVIYESLAAE